MTSLQRGCSRRDFILDSALLALATGWQSSARPLEAIFSPSQVSRNSSPVMSVPPRELAVLEDAIQHQTMLGSMPLGITTSMGMIGAASNSNTLASNRLGFLGMATRA